jgi:hypothetical protein
VSSAPPETLVSVSEGNGTLAINRGGTFKFIWTGGRST